MKAHMKFGIICLSLFVVNCVTNGKVNKKDTVIDLQTSYNKIISSHNTIELQASRIANREVKRKDIPGILTNICNNTCEADYLDCVIGKIPNIDPGGHPSRANRDFNVEIPPCDEPDCDDKKNVPGDDIQPCEDSRDTCLKRCACL